MALLVLLASSGCGRRAELLGTIVSPSDGPALEADGSPRLQFSQPELVVAVSDPLAYDADPSFTGDLLEMFFMSDRAGTKDIWTSRRANASDPWGSPAIVSTLSSPATDEGPSVSLDGKRIWFATDRDGSRHIWQSSRASRNDAWAAPVRIAELASAADDLGPAVDALETTMFFGSNRALATSYDVFSTTRATTSEPWGAPSPVPGVNSPFDDKAPFVAQGGLIIFFTSSRTGAGDLYWSTRESVAEPFPSPLPLVELNSAAYDSDPSLSQDLTYILFDSQRSGISDIYEAHAVANAP